jgi:hypothetical protein
MAFRRQRQVVEHTRRGWVIRLDPDEFDLLRTLLAELRGLLQSDDPVTEPIRRRLFPPAYHLADDAEAEVEYQRLMRDELVASRLASLDQLDELLAADRFDASERGVVLDDAGMQAFLQSLNGLRLVLGTMLDVGESDELDDLPRDHPLFNEHHLYAFLSALLEVAVQTFTQRRGR